MSEKKDIQTNIIIIGAGLSGLTLACILAQEGIDVVCIDRADPNTILNAQYDGRTTAISLGSRTVLEKAKLWNDIADEGCAIEDIHIMDNSSPVLLEFLSRDAQEDAFGWIFENLTLRQAMYKRAAEIDTLTLLAPQNISSFEQNDDYIRVHTDDGKIVSGKLLIGADGRGSAVRKWAGIKTRQWSYHQHAVICTVHHENPHSNIAIEDFRKEGPFAVLPMQDDEHGNHRSSVVWSNHSQKEDENPAHWPKEVFEMALNTRFPDFYGQVSLVGERASYPLGLIHAYQYIAPRTTLVADAAHGIHPIAGQGLNLGYRDVDVLSDLLIEAHQTNKDFGGDNILKSYQRKRRLDVTAMAATTDILNRLFSNQSKSLSIARKVGLQMVQNIKPAKSFFMNQAMGKASIKSKD